MIKRKFKRFLKWLKSGDKKMDRMRFHNQAISHYCLVFCQSKHPEVKEFALKKMNVHLRAMIKINRL